MRYQTGNKKNGTTDKYEFGIDERMMELVDCMENLVIKHREWLQKHPEITRGYNDIAIVMDSCKPG
ncbi:MAG: hypothetical protein R6U89_08590 [Dehalococcoidia bacterium]